MKGPARIGRRRSGPYHLVVELNLSQERTNMNLFGLMCPQSTLSCASLFSNPGGGVWRTEQRGPRASNGRGQQSAAKVPFEPLPALPNFNFTTLRRYPGQPGQRPSDSGYRYYAARRQCQLRRPAVGSGVSRPFGGRAPCTAGRSPPVQERATDGRRCSQVRSRQIDSCSAAGSVLPAGSSFDAWSRLRCGHLDWFSRHHH